MPQGAIPVLNKNAGGLYTFGGITATGLVKAPAVTLMRVVITAAGSAGTLTIVDAATSGQVSGAVVLYNAAYTAIPGGSVITLEEPIVNGIWVSAIATGMTVLVTCF
jgi:hypothetical protein